MLLVLYWENKPDKKKKKDLTKNKEFYPDLKRIVFTLSTNQPRHWVCGEPSQHIRLSVSLTNSVADKFNYLIFWGVNSWQMQLPFLWQFCGKCLMILKEECNGNRTFQLCVPGRKKKEQCPMVQFKSPL